MIIKLNDLLGAMKQAWQGVAPGDFVSNFRFIKFEVAKDKLRLRTFNGTLGVEVAIPATDSDGFKSLVMDADRLNRYLQGFDPADSRDVTITQDQGKITFIFKRAGKLVLTPAQTKSEFWQVPKLDSVDWCITMDDKFKTSCKLLLSIAGLDTARLVTQGIFMDGDTMHVTSGAAVGEFKAKGQFKKPLAMVYDFVGMLAGMDSEVKIGTGGNFIVARASNITFVQSMFRCAAPDFSTMLDPYRKPIAKVMVGMKDFVERFKRIGNMTDQSNRGVKLVFKAGVLKFGFEDGEATVREQVRYSGNYDGEVLLNFAYVKGYLDELATRKLKQLELGFIGPGKGVVFRIAEPFVLVLLPMVTL